MKGTCGPADEMLTYKNPTENIIKTWILLFQLRFSFNRDGMGSEITDRSMAISKEARIHEKRLILIQRPDTSPVHPCHRYDTGEHCRTMVMAFEMPKQTAKTIRPIAALWNLSYGKTRR
jgi:hypothetical protein